MSHKQSLSLGPARRKGSIRITVSISGIVVETAEEAFQSPVSRLSDLAVFDEPQQERAAKNLVGRVRFLSNSFPLAATNPRRERGAPPELLASGMGAPSSES